MSKLKLIWDFRGPDARRIAEHHCTHLTEYIASENLDQSNSGHEDLNEMHAIAYLIVKESDMIPVRDALRPHRAQVFE